MAEMLFVPDYDGAILVPENVGDFLCGLAFAYGQLSVLGEPGGWWRDMANAAMEHNRYLNDQIAREAANAAQEASMKQEVQRERASLRVDLSQLREQLAAVEAERDVWSGKACEDEQAKGKGPCGACRHCLPALLKAAENERDELRRQLNSRNTPPGSAGFTPPWF